MRYRFMVLHRMFLRRTSLALSMAWLISAQVLGADKGNFACPDGQSYKNHFKPDDDLKFEWCVDDQQRMQGIMRVTVLSNGHVDGLVPYINGKKHGVGIHYDATGEPAYEVVYENGVKKRSGLTRQALVKIAEEISEDARTHFINTGAARSWKGRDGQRRCNVRCSGPIG
jgi:hypothetical protein